MMMMNHLRVVLVGFVILVVGIGISTRAYGEVSQVTMRKIHSINEKGPYLGIIVPNAFEMSPLLQSSSFVADPKLPYLDLSGKYMHQVLI